MHCTNPVRLSKTKTRSIKLKLPVDLLDAVKEMGRDAARSAVGASRDLRNMIECSLLWAVWAHSRGRGPDEEIWRLENRYGECASIIRARQERREVEELETLYKLGDLQTVPGQQKQKRRD
jgi:hypothetical protein